MVKYRNPRHEQENLETEFVEQEMEILKEPANNVEEELWKKRYSDLRKHQTKTADEFKNQVTELERKLELALRGQIKAPKSDEEIESWMKEYPEFASILETIVQKRIHEATSKTESELSNIREEQKKIDRERAVLELRKLHPDFEKLVKDQGFHEWLAKQSQKHQDAIYRGLDVEDAAFVIDKYKAQNGSKSQGDEDPNMNDVAKVVKSSSSREPIENFGDYDYTESEIEKKSRSNAKWFEQNEEKIMTALRKGRVLMDLSGGAR